MPHIRRHDPNGIAHIRTGLQRTGLNREAAQTTQTNLKPAPLPGRIAYVQGNRVVQGVHPVRMPGHFKQEPMSGIHHSPLWTLTYAQP